MNKKLIYSAVSLVILFAAAQAFAQNVTIPNPLTGVNSFADLLCKIAGGIGTLIAALGTIAILISGVLYLTSAGNPTKMTAAKVALFSGIIGIVIGLLAQTIVTIVVVDILGGSSSSACAAPSSGTPAN